MRLPVGARDVRGAAVADALVSGVVTFAWYAMPDVVASRGLRGLLKAGLLGGAVAYGAARGFERSDDAGAPGPGGGGPRDGGAVGAALVAVGAVTVATESALHRWGERLARRGVRAPHARVGLVAAVVAALAGAAGELLTASDEAPSG